LEFGILYDFGKVLFQMLQGFFCSNEASRSFEISNVRLPSDEDETSEIPETVDAIRERCWCINIPTTCYRRVGFSEFWKPMPSRHYEYPVVLDSWSENLQIRQYHFPVFFFEKRWHMDSGAHQKLSGHSIPDPDSGRARRRK